MLKSNIGEVDEDTNNRRDQILEVNQRIEDLTSVLQNTKITLMAELRMIAAQLASWMVVVKKEKIFLSHFLFFSSYFHFL